MGVWVVVSGGRWRPQVAGGWIDYPYPYPYPYPLKYYPFP
jgi:hypothetical protein